MNEPTPIIPKWILIISALLALMEFLYSISVFVAPQSVMENVDLPTKGMLYIAQMWAMRQFALGVICAYAVIKKSAPMLLLVYIYFLTMFVGDLATGISLKENSQIISAVVMSLVSMVMIYMINRKRAESTK